ncbi:hypothetical protein GCM10010518_13860 [Kitasatospora cinereorecta]
MRTHPQKDEPRHLIPRTLSSRTPPDVSTMLSECTCSWKRLEGALDGIVTDIRRRSTGFRTRRGVGRGQSSVLIMEAAAYVR